MTYRFDIQSFVDLHDQPFLVIDRAYRVVAVNSAFEKNYGIAKSAAKGQRCCELIRGDGRPCPCDSEGEDCRFREVFAGDGPRACESSYQDDDGRQHRVKITGFPLRTEHGDLFLGELIQFDHIPIEPAADAPDGKASAMVGESPGFRSMVEQLDLAARCGASVLIWGQTGTGKELAAAFMHERSPRRAGPFLTLDCTAITEDLFESEVFGYARGAFTGSVGEKTGLFELANGGTLFLDEIGELPLALQAKLLRVLETGQFRRVGGVKTRSADVRVLCATNREIRNVAWFRQDLYYRVACFRVNLLPLSERMEDLPILADKLLQQISVTSGRPLQFGDDALSALDDYGFPGNIRELRNILWVASVNSANGLISAREIAMGIPKTPDQSPVVTCHAARPVTANVAAERVPFSMGLENFESEQLARLLREHQGNRREIARALGVSERTVYRKLKRFGLG